MREGCDVGGGPEGVDAVVCSGSLVIGGVGRSGGRPVALVLIPGAQGVHARHGAEGFIGDGAADGVRGVAVAVEEGVGF